ncbi:transcription initiation factor TFIID subunit 2-like [Arctopsyche grandis]|uniref:transcription initiation factor TFIID subunit 2-like n=1 Tax=Arctopsyche grandis TaxID=121162 RepID=UPI00406D8D91
MLGFLVRIKYSIRNPTAGIQFVDHENDSAYMFTHGHSARLWFPCIDKYSTACKWTLKYFISQRLTVVSNGDALKIGKHYKNDRKLIVFKVFHPTPAPNITMAIGPFSEYPDPWVPAVTHYCMPSVLPFVSHYAMYTQNIIIFYRRLLSNAYPHVTYKQVFLDHARVAARDSNQRRTCLSSNDAPHPPLLRYHASPHLKYLALIGCVHALPHTYAHRVDDKFYSYSSVTLFSIRLLQKARLIDNGYKIKKTLAEAYGKQFYGCFILFDRWSDLWLDYGIAKYFATLYIKQTFGLHYYQREILLDLIKVVEFERKYGGLVINIWNDAICPNYMPDNARLPRANSQIPSHQFFKVAKKKSHLIMIIIEKFIGESNLVSILRTKVHSTTTLRSSYLSSSQFVSDILQMTGKNISTLIHGCVNSGGHHDFNMTYEYQKNSNGVRLYLGPLTLKVHEVSGLYIHEIAIVDAVVKCDIPCHDFTETDHIILPVSGGVLKKIDLTEARETDCPVLWVRLDPEVSMIRTIAITQLVHQWHYQLKCERNIMGQYEALIALSTIPKDSTLTNLNGIIMDDDYFFMIRCSAILAMNRVMLVLKYSHGIDVVGKFRKLYRIGTDNCNSFERNLYEWVFPKIIIQRLQAGKYCPPEYIPIMIDSLRKSESDKRFYTYTSALVKVLIEAVIPKPVETPKSPITQIHPSSVKITKPVTPSRPKSR